METNKTKLIIVFIGVYLTICPVLFAQDNIQSYLFTNSIVTDDTIHDCDFIYNSLYAKKSMDETDGFADILNYKIGWKLKASQSLISAGYEHNRFRAKLKALSNENDWMRLLSENEQIRLSLSKKIHNSLLSSDILLGDNPGLYIEYSNKSQVAIGSGIGILFRATDVDYRIKGINGKIPFNWYSVYTQNRLSFKQDFVKLKLSTTLPAKPEAGFDNKLFSSGMTLQYSKQLLVNVAVKGNTSYSFTYADLRYNGDRYAKLDNLHALYSNIFIEYQQLERLKYSLGCRATFTKIGEDSYFDIWPFSYWDMFLAHRTRIKKADSNSQLPYISITYSKDKVYNKSLSYDVGLEYNHLFHSEDIVIKNRRVIIYPFLFAYDTEYYDFKGNTDGFLIVPVNAYYLCKWGIGIGVTAKQVLPLDWSSIFTQRSITTPTTGNKVKETGGSSIRLYIDFPLPEL